MTDLTPHVTSDKITIQQITRTYLVLGVLSLVLIKWTEEGSESASTIQHYYALLSLCSIKNIDFHGSDLDQYQLPIVLNVFICIRRIVFILSFPFYLLKSSKYAGHTPRQSVQIQTGSMQSLKRKLCEGSRRFHNHGEGPYYDLLVESAYQSF